MPKSKKVKQLERSASEDAYFDNENVGHKVYVFNNVLFNFNMYINAESADEACSIFDSCGFAHRDQWKIMVELKQQPSRGPDGE